ncbi:MAG: peptidogalycan biosysnthesis protein, partial [Thioalkalispiraceae bacterium]
MKIEILDSLKSIQARQWNHLAGKNNPFIQYEFLFALENNRCLEEFGWYPRHIVAFENEQAVAAMPAYIKDNSYGELVFDWAWADAYHRAGLPYYPKLVTAIPYTPVTGPRLLVAPEQDYAACATLLTDTCIKQAEHLNMSSMHWLFTDKRDSAFLKRRGYAMRLGCQFHWQNNSYRDFDDFLAHLTSSKRKKIKRERRYVVEQDVELEIRHGRDMTDELWEIYHNFYTSTFNKKSGIPTLQLEFFREIGETMPDSVVIVFAKHAGDHVA